MATTTAAATAAGYIPESDIRLEDYLDDKLQSTTDLESSNLSALLETVESQRHALQTQLDEATRALERARTSSEDKQSVLQSRIDDFQGLQQRIDLRQAIIADSDAPDLAVQRLSGPLQQLHKVELAKRYVELLQDVERWRAEALQHLPASPRDALDPYSNIKRVAGRLGALQHSADEAGVHLVGYVKGVAEMLWEDMKRTMTAEMEAVLRARKWPNIELESEEETVAVMDEEWIGCFGKMIDLQVPEIIYHQSSTATENETTTTTTVVTLLPIHVMTKAFIQEFRFHFLSDRPTSKPEALPACFRWFTSLVAKWEPFLRFNLSSLLAAKFQEAPTEPKLVYVDPVSAFITCLLPAMREKVLGIADLAVAQEQAQFLSPLIADVTAFDDKMRKRFHYDGGDAEKGWPGLASSILDRHFGTWFDAEKTFALERLHGIMSSPEARGIDYEFGPVGKTKPTHGAVRIIDLLKNVTATYKGRRKLEHKLQFLVEVQNAVLEEFEDRLRGSLEAYQSLTSTMGRTLHGVSKEQLAALEGTGAFESLCKVLGSADYVVRMLEGWGMDEFFIGLWHDLQLLVRQLGDTRTNPNLAPTLSYSRVKSVTSPSLGLALAARDDAAGVVDHDDHTDGTTVGVEGGAGGAGGGGARSTIFDAPVAAYGNIRHLAEDLLVDALVDSHRTAFKNYASKTQFTTLSDDASPPSSSSSIRHQLSADLPSALTILRRNVEYTATTLSAPTYRRVWRHVLSKLSDLLWSQVLFHHSFTTLGADQLGRDIAAVTAVAAARLRQTDHFALVREGVELLSLPVEVGTGGGEGGGENGEGGGENGGGNRERMRLKDVYDRIFSGNAEAREVLEELNLQLLTPTNARNILQRRVEAGE